MIKQIGQRKAYTFIINSNQYLELKEQLNKEKKTIIKITPTFIAGNISDKFVIFAINKN